MGYKEENDYRRFIGHLKILSMQADYKQNKETAEEYKHTYKMLDKIRVRRYLAQIGEETEEKKLYNQIIQMINEKYDESNKSTEELVKAINENIDYEYEEENKKEEIVEER